MFTDSVVQQIESELGKRHPKTDAALYERIDYICKEIKNLKSRRPITQLAALREAARPFTQPIFRRILGGNNDGDNSIVFARGDAVLTIGDFRKLAAELEKS